MAYTDGKIIIGTSVDVGGIGTGLSKINKAFNKLGQLASVAIGFGALARLGKAALDAASDLQEVQNVVDVAFEDMAYKIESFASTSIENFGMSELAAKQTASSFMAMGKSMGLSLEEASDIAVNLTALTGDFASFYNISQDYARVAMSAVYTGETETLKRYGIVLTEANLQEYAATLGISKKVKAMGAREKALLRYSYVLKATADMEGDFVRTENSWANQVRVLQQRWNQFLIVLGNGLITVFTPLLEVLNLLIGKLIQFSRLLGVIISNIFGIKFQNIVDENAKLKKSNEAAAASEDKFSNSIKNSAKNIKKYLAPFDELNVMKKDAAQGAGGGDELNLDDLDIAIGKYNEIGEALDKIKSTINTLYDFGLFLGNTLADVLRRVDWPKIYQGAKNFGKGLAEFLNGLIDSDLFKELGRTIASALNTAIYAVLGFGTTLDWKALGKAFATGINNFFASIDAAALANAADSIIKGIFDALVSAVTNIDWKQAFSKIKEFFQNLDAETVWIIFGFIALKKLLKAGLIRALTEGFAEGFGINLGEGIISPFIKSFGFTLGAKLKGLTVIIGDSLKTAFSGAFSSLGTILPTILSTVAGIASIIGGAVLAVKSFFDMWSDGWSVLKTILEAIGIALAAVGAIILGAPALIAAVVGAVVFAVSQIAILLHDNWDAVVQWLADVGSAIAEFGSWLWDGIKAAAKWIYDNFLDPVFSAFSKFFETIGKLAEGCWIIIKAIWIVVGKWFEDTVINPLVEKFTWWKDLIVNLFKLSWLTSQYVWGAVAGWFKDHVIDPIVGFFQAWADKIKSDFENTWNFIKAIFLLVEPFIKAWNLAILGTFMWLGNQIKTFFSGVFDFLINSLKFLVNGFISLIEKGINGIIDTVNNFFSGFNGLVKVASVITGDKWDGISLLNRVSLPRLAKGAVIPPNHEFAAILGDQRHGTNIEAPLDTIKQAVAEELNTQIEAMMAGFQAVVDAINNKDLIIDEDAIGKSAYNYNTRQSFIRGV